MLTRDDAASMLVDCRLAISLALHLTRPLPPRMQRRLPSPFAWCLSPATPPTDRDNWMGHDRGAALEHTIQRCEHSDVDALASMLRNPSLTNVMHL